MDQDILKKKKLTELKEIATTFNIPNYYKLKKNDLILAIENSFGSEEKEELIEEPKGRQEEFEQDYNGLEDLEDLEDISDNASEEMEKLEDVNIAEGILELHLDG